jgi:hypothetical protein
MKPFIFSLIFLVNQVQAQKAGPAGAYYLQGVMETASGFQLNEDSSFKFFYSYGMLDRYGTGRWAMHGDQIILNSRTRPPYDFKMLVSRREPGDSITISIKDNNEILLRYIHCQLRSVSGISDMKTNDDGIARFAKSPMDSVALIFQLCPDRFSVFAVDPAANYFEFGFEPWIVEVFFDHFELRYLGNELSGRHPLIQGNEFHYEKAEK